MASSTVITTLLLRDNVANACYTLFALHSYSHLARAFEHAHIKFKILWLCIIYTWFMTKFCMWINLSIHLYTVALLSLVTSVFNSRSKNQDMHLICIDWLHARFLLDL